MILKFSKYHIISNMIIPFPKLSYHIKNNISISKSSYLIETIIKFLN